jgi:hypothetical protein
MNKTSAFVNSLFVNLYVEDDSELLSRTFLTQGKEVEKPGGRGYGKRFFLPIEAGGSLGWKNIFVNVYFLFIF